MYIITVKIRNQSEHFLTQLTCGTHRDLSVIFTLPHFNSSKVVSTTVEFLSVSLQAAHQCFLEIRIICQED